jgi:DNA-binding transcriptional MocR family regulator
MDLNTLPTEGLVSLRARLEGRYQEFRARGLTLNMARGKPSEAQLSLSQRLLELPGQDDATSAAGDDVRNYFGEAQGLTETRAIFTGLLGAPIEQIILGDNSSLALMHDTIVVALLFGLPDSPRPWAKEEQITFLCPAPGYDRHFGICEGFGIKMIPITMTPTGPDMREVEPKTNGRFGLPWRSAASRTFASSGASSARTWTL